MYDQTFRDKCLELLTTMEENMRATLKFLSEQQKRNEQLPSLSEQKKLPTTETPVVEIVPSDLHVKIQSVFNEQTIALIKDYSENFTNVILEKCLFVKYMCSSLRYCPINLILSFANYLAPTTLCIAQKLTFDSKSAVKMEFDPNDNKLLQYLLRIFTFL